MSRERVFRIFSQPLSVEIFFASEYLLEYLSSRPTRLNRHKQPPAPPRWRTRRPLPCVSIHRCVGLILRGPRPRAGAGLFVSRQEKSTPLGFAFWSKFIKGVQAGLLGYFTALGLHRWGAGFIEKMVLVNNQKRQRPAPKQKPPTSYWLIPK